MLLNNINVGSFPFFLFLQQNLIVTLKNTTEVIDPISMQALFSWINHLLVLCSTITNKHHSWNVKITKVLISDLNPYKDVWAKKFKNVLPNKWYNLHAMRFLIHKQVKFIFIDGNNNEQILKFKFVFLFLHDKIMM